MCEPSTQSNTKITVSCPSGHRLRGGPDLIGKMVKCPRCQWQFIFAPETKREEAVSMRPCPRCHVSIPESVAVCDHCNCYVGVLPSFMREMVDSSRSASA